MYETITFNVDQRQNVWFWFFNLRDLRWRNHQNFSFYRKAYTMKSSFLLDRKTLTCKMMMGGINAHIAARFPRPSFEVAEYIMIYRLRYMSRDTWLTHWKFGQHIGGRASHECNTCRYLIVARGYFEYQCHFSVQECWKWIVKAILIVNG